MLFDMLVVQFGALVLPLELFEAKKAIFMIRFFVLLDIIFLADFLVAGHCKTWRFTGFLVCMRLL